MTISRISARGNVTVRIQSSMSSAASRRMVRLGEDPVQGLRHMADRFGYAGRVDVTSVVFPVWFRTIPVKTS